MNQKKKFCSYNEPMELKTKWNKKRNKKKRDENQRIS